MLHPIKHFRTITKHRHKVIAHCRKAGIFWQGLGHDLSKYSFSEFWTGAKYYSGKFSPNENERRDKGYSAAWMHHKGRNRHHFEYWTDIDVVTKRTKAVEMPVRFAAEMFCDRVAASKIYKGDSYTDRSALEYFSAGDKTRRFINENTSALLESWLTTLADKGEDAAFAEVRAAVSASKAEKKAAKAAEKQNRRQHGQQTENKNTESKNAEDKSRSV